MSVDEALAALDAFTGQDGETLFIGDAEVNAWLVFAREGARLRLDASFPGAERRSRFLRLRVRDQQDVMIENAPARQTKRLIEMLAQGDLSGLAAELGRPWL